MTAPVVHQRVAVVANDALSARHHLLTFESRAIAAGAGAGRFVSLRVRDSYDPLLRRPMGIYRVLPETGAAEAFQIVIQVVGRGTRALAELRPGDQVSCIGPLGNTYSLPPANARALLVAGGIGIAPFHLWARELQRRGIAAELLYGARTAAELVCLRHFRDLGLPLWPATEDGSLGFRGRVTELLAERLAAGERDRAVVYACGPEPMLARVQQLAEVGGVAAELCLDRMMSCASGVCLTCVVGVRRGESLTYQRVCTEGPVFAAAGLML